MQKLLDAINSAVSEFNSYPRNSVIRIISHNDCDGLTSAGILAGALRRKDYRFHLSTARQLDNNVIEQLKSEKNDILFILDLSCDFSLLKKDGKIFVLDHHEIKNADIPENITLINPFFINDIKKEDEISGAGITYLFAKNLDEKNRDLANLAIVGMVGDVLGGNLSRLNNIILNDSEVNVKKTLPLLYANMPLHKALEYSSNMFIPGVTGNAEGAINLLRESGIDYRNKSLSDLGEEDLSRLVTSIVLKRASENMEGDIDNIIDNVYSLKFFGRIEDARELSALMNSCGKLGKSDIALEMCFGSAKARVQAENMYRDYRSQLVSGINYVKNMLDKRQGEKYVIFNCRNEINDGIIGTIMSILSMNMLFPPGNVLAGLAYRKDGKIKVSARVSKSKNKDEKPDVNLKEVMCKVCRQLSIEDEAGGHAAAAGCLVPISREEEFINVLENTLRGITPSENSMGTMP